MLPRSLWGLPLGSQVSGGESSAAPAFHLVPHYRAGRPLDATLLKANAAHDDFVSEIYVDKIDGILAAWAGALLKAPSAHIIAGALASDFTAASLQPAESRLLRSELGIEVRKNRFAAQPTIGRAEFLRQFEASFSTFSRVIIAEFQIIAVDVVAAAAAQLPSRIETRIRYEIIGAGADFYREQHAGYWHLVWDVMPGGEFRVLHWQTIDETQARARSPVYRDIADAALSLNSSFADQLQHGSDYWRTVLDGACGIDIYGHNGVSVADIDNDGFDDLYICQPAGLPNRLYRNRGDGTFEDVTEPSGLGILENTACALFADFNNDGLQDVILVRARGPLLFINEGGGRFREKPNAFQFAHPPQGTFTGSAVADYDRDGWLDVYFCLYSYYQGTGQYKYPSPYHDAENGPPNFLMRNQRDGTFRDVTAESGLQQNNTRYSFACAWGDFNRDGWPDLYVVNDFGRKNLYRNNGDGTFTDVAPQVGAEDIGAGMSGCWFDYDNEGADDLYVANMWTAAGLRISTQNLFRKDSSSAVRALYRKHAMGNSLLRDVSGDRAGTFEDVTEAAGVGMGRWSWSSDAFDFDHDGFADLYIANGMVSGPSRQDLNSFFWRQVVAKSPDDARADKSYEQGWNAINELIRSDGTWSGYERNVFYANHRDGTFSDLSAVVGLDFVEDGRSFALADFDRDGRMEIVLKNRNAPQVRILKNAITDLPPAIAFRLRGTRSNRDAIGAVVTIETDVGRQTRALQAGSGFLSQHGKELFFGLGAARGTVRASIRWPSGAAQELRDLPQNHCISVEEGSDSYRAAPFRASTTTRFEPIDRETRAEADSLPEEFETWLLAPIAAPEFSLLDSSGQTRTLAQFHGQPLLLNFWTANSAQCQSDLKTFQRSYSHWRNRGLQLAVININENNFALPSHLGFPLLHGSDDLAAIYNILYRQLFDRHRDLVLPTSFLIDADGAIVKVYRGPVDAGQVERDAQNIPNTDAERLTRALPFPSKTHTLEFGRNYLSYGALFFQRGYLAPAKAAFERAFRDDPSSAEALYGVGSVQLNQNDNAAARATFEQALKLQASYPDTLPDSWNNLGVIATREGRVDDSIECFRQALRLNPHHLLALVNLGSAYRLAKRWDEARLVLAHAVEIAPQDAEANYGLAMVFAQADETEKTYEYLQRALQARPDYPEALNNLGILYLRTNRRDDAVATFEQCIRVAPAFDQAYLNLARVYAIEGSRDEARSVLLLLLKQRPEHALAQQMLLQLQP